MQQPKKKLDWTRLGTHRCPACGAGLVRRSTGMGCSGGSVPGGGTCTFFVRMERYRTIRRDMGFTNDPWRDRGLPTPPEFQE